MSPETSNEGQPVSAWVDWMETSTIYAHFPLRIALAAVFLFHGLNKFFVAGIDGFATMMGLPLFAGFLVALAEVAIGVLILVGMFDQIAVADTATRVAGLLTMLIMISAIGMVHWGKGFHFMDNGWAFQFTLAMVGLFFALRGNRI